MWNELESYRNNFLQWRFPTFRAQTLNMMVKKEFKSHQKSKKSCIFPCKDKPQSSSYFDDRAKKAYGFWALPQLMNEACSDVPLTQWRALNSLSELLMNPLEAQRGINEEDIIRNRRKHGAEMFDVVGRLIYIFYTLSMYLNGAQQIAIKQNLLHEYYTMIYNREKYTKMASKILVNLSEKPKVLLHLIERTEALNYLTMIFLKDRCTPHYPHALWVHLSNFFEVVPEQAIENGFFDLLHQRILGRVPQYHRMNMKCFALLLQNEIGQHKFDECHGLQLFHCILTEDNPLDTYEYIIMAIQNALIGKRTLWRCCEYMDIANILVKLAGQNVRDCDKRQSNSNESDGKLKKDSNANTDENDTSDLSGEHSNIRMQLYCLQSIRQMGQMPIIKRYIRQTCLKNIRNIQCVNEFNSCVRDDLVNWLNTEAFCIE